MIFCVVYVELMLQKEAPINITSIVKREMNLTISTANNRM